MTEGNTSLTSPSNSSMEFEIDYFMDKAFYIILYVQWFISLSGLFGNILVIILIQRRSLRNTSAAVHITYMAIFNSAVLILHAAYLTKPWRNLSLQCPFTYLIDLFQFCANWTLVIITFERYVAVTRPHLSARFCTVVFARRSIFILVSSGIILLSLPFSIRYDIDENFGLRLCYMRRQYRSIRKFARAVVLFGLPYIFLLLNFYTLYNLIRRQRQQSENSVDFDPYILDARSNRKQYRLTIMLVAVNLAFYAFSIPTMISYTVSETIPLSSTVEEFKRLHLFTNIPILLQQLQYATLFIFYYLATRGFRQVALDTLQEGSAR